MNDVKLPIIGYVLMGESSLSYTVMENGQEWKIKSGEVTALITAPLGVKERDMIQHLRQMLERIEEHHSS